MVTRVLKRSVKGLVFVTGFALMSADVTVAQSAATADGLNLETDALFFRSGSAQLTADSETRLAALTEVLKTSIMDGTCLKLVGHSDTTGSAQTNLTVSIKRAEHIQAKLLQSLSADGPPIEIEGKGEAEPLAGIAGGDARNRRVIIWAKKCGT
ncbi:MAG: OmpA family protein [Pseudoruegeria sp.]